MNPVEHMDRLQSALERLEPAQVVEEEEPMEENEDVYEHSSKYSTPKSHSIPIQQQRQHSPRDELMSNQSPGVASGIMIMSDEFNHSNGQSPRHIGFSLEKESSMEQYMDCKEGDHEHESPEFKRKRKEHYNEYFVMKKMRERNQRYLQSGELSDEEDDSSSDDDDDQ